MMKFYLTLLLLAIAATQLIQAARTNDIIANRKKQNFFDPIYAFDDIDAHIVPAVASIDHPEVRKQETAKPVVLVSSFVSAKKNVSQANGQQQQQQQIRANQQKRASSLFEDLAGGVPKSASERPKFETAAAATATTGDTLATPTRAALSSPSNQYDLSIVQVAQQKPAPEKHHWSGLENYYKMLQQQQQRQFQPNPVDDTIYQLSQEPDHRDDSLGWPHIWNNNNNNQATKSSGPFFIPGYNVGQLATAGKAQSGFSLPLDQSYRNPVVGATKGHHTTEQSPIVESNVYDRGSNRDLDTLPRDELLRLLKQQQQTKNLEQRRYPAIDFFANPTISAGQQQQHQHQERLPTVHLNDGRVVHHDTTKLQEFMDIQRQQQRYRHQQETFGSIYDPQRMREQYQEEIYCRARNLVNIRLAPTGGGGSSNQTILNADQLSRLSQLRIDPSGSQDVTVQLSAGEFPSHMGIYNGTPSEDTFLCAASWIHDGYALTVATCLDSLNPKILTARFGEWNLNRPIQGGADAKLAQQMFTSPVREIIVFPRYNKNSSLEHNLALIRFEQPINFLQVPYASPACQRESRNSLQRAKSCWTPVRNITLSEYFDADGEGETKEKKNVAMIELPVKLIADDDAECFRQSGTELFNFNHPNYICSADYRRAPWRAKLNQSDYFGSGIYCNEAGNLSLVSLLHPIGKNSSTAVGYLDLSYYRPWMRSVIFAQN